MPAQKAIISAIVEVLSPTTSDNRFQSHNVTPPAQETRLKIAVEPGK